MMDIKYPAATWRPLSENATARYIVPRVLIWHTAVDSKAASSLWPYFERGTDLESTFWLPWSGVMEQYMSLNRQADANYKANPFATSVETEDDGDPSIPWSADQLQSMLAFGFWWSNETGVALKVPTTWDGSGVGYHSMYPMVWTPYKGKDCPGPVRIKQFHDILLPAWAKGASFRPPVPQEKIVQSQIVAASDPYREFVLYTGDFPPTAVYLRTEADRLLAQYLGAKDSRTDDAANKILRISVLGASV